MTCDTGEFETTYPSRKGRAAQIREVLGHILWVVPGVAVVCLALFLSIGRTRLSETGVEFVIVFVYSALIGPPSAFLLTWISQRFANRFPRFVLVLDTFALVGTATAGMLAGDLILRWLGIFSRGSYWAEFRGSLPFGLIITLITGLSITTYETLRFKLQSATLELRTRQVEQERANKLLAEARLSSLESRIHPHFLFNTLNSIAALIPSDPKRAEDTVAKLASLLRFSLNVNHTRLVPLSQELKIVRDYLEIESTRFGARLRYRIHTLDSADSIHVPPLALQTLVENSVKHVAAHRPEGAEIAISGARDDGRVHLEVSDDGPGFSLGAITPDHGLGNLVMRLNLLFGERGTLDVARENNKTVVRLSFPAEA